MTSPSARSWRALLVSIHVISAVCWLGQALSMIALLALSVSSPPKDTKIAAAAMANQLDLSILGFSALVATFTGFGLSTVTAWGYFHHWWVSTKFVLTLAQIALGTLVLGQVLPTVVVAARAGTDGAAVPVAIGLGCVAGGLALQVWLSVAKPKGRTPLGRKEQRLNTAPVAVIAMMVVLPLIDTALHVVGFLSLPTLTPIGLIVALLVRRRHGRRARPPASPPLASPDAATGTCQGNMPGLGCGRWVWPAPPRSARASFIPQTRTHLVITRHITRLSVPPTTVPIRDRPRALPRPVRR